MPWSSFKACSTYFVAVTFSDGEESIKEEKSKIEGSGLQEIVQSE